MLPDRSLSDPDMKDDNPGHAPKAHPLLPNAPRMLRYIPEHAWSKSSQHMITYSVNERRM